VSRCLGSQPISGPQSRQQISGIETKKVGQLSPSLHRYSPFRLPGILGINWSRAARATSVYATLRANAGGTGRPAHGGEQAIRPLWILAVPM